MSGGEQFDKRLEELACELAAASDIATVLAIRTEALQLIAATRAARGRRTRRIGRALELKRQAELKVGDLLLSLRDAGLRLSYRGPRRGADGSHLASLGDFGIGSWATADRWEKRARARRLEQLTGAA